MASGVAEVEKWWMEIGDLNSGGVFHDREIWILEIRIY